MALYAYASTLSLIAARHQRRPARSTPGLDALFRRLSACGSEPDALDIEEHNRQLLKYAYCHNYIRPQKDQIGD